MHVVGLERSGKRRETVRVDPDESLLAAAERSGIGLPFGCRIGVCGTCTGRVLDGEMRHVEPPRALKDRHLEAGYVLTCIATPEVDCTVEVGTDVRARLFENPWR
ncbi:2Fe-2S iron-sulfur cluster-binding protein [Halalkalicoccus jeotgali]|uniref:Ferredoxin n=1 Tax=Halalkalicoccus jeotgali (strain DSM 18796 / CECT 7217 / JCM 14584 / KCTC 4019 / B3) TaxID=795797 RepID=D8J5Z2_HALJB|nr:2Fe-2S iron-sulfur cluster-binding protein [Halalkalicoccus jeotgali]ADJ13798.1 ferredoxin [Halalkalicoccus jeotgali B3]ELY34156.1 ferredoxin [Halalkalicoccus jeotgali B3]